MLTQFLQWLIFVSRESFLSVGALTIDWEETVRNDTVVTVPMLKLGRSTKQSMDGRKGRLTDRNYA